MLDLITLWSNIAGQNSIPEASDRAYDHDVKPGALKFDKETIQSSFEFNTPPNVIFVKNITTLEPADVYDDLPEIILTKEENDARLKVVEEQTTKNPRFYDGQQMVVTGVVYDESSVNTLYLEARKVPYSFIVALSARKFPEHSAIYQLTVFKTGALAPLITRNGMSLLVQRADGLYSVPGGFLESHDEEKRLNFNDGRNLITETAIAELREEIAGIAGSDKLRFEFSNTQITSISIRKTGTSPIGTVEFVTPSYADCHSSYLQHVFLNNSAQDAQEHTSKHELVSLDSRERDSLLKTLLTGPVKLPGASLYLPVALSLSRLENQDRMIDLPRAMPNSASVAWPLSVFTPRPTKSLSMLTSKPDHEVVEKDLTLSHKMTC